MALTQDEADDLLLKSAENGNLDDLKRAIDSLKALNRDINQVDDENAYTAIHHAAMNGHPDAVKMLIENGADVNSEDEFGKTPLFYAADLNSLPIAQVLVANGVDVNHVSSNGETALHSAGSKGGCDVLKFLLDHGADRNVQSRSRNTPFSFSVTYKHTECVRALLEAGADVNQPIKSKPPILMVFYSRGSDFAEPPTDTLSLLIERGADINYTDPGLGRTPLSASFENGWENHAKLLLERGANPNVSYLADDVGTRIGLRRINPELTDKLISTLCEKGFEDGQCDVLKQTPPTTAPAAGTRKRALKKRQTRRGKKRFHKKK